MKQLGQAFCILGKLPKKGFSKTRLAEKIGEPAALEIYQALLRDFFSHYQKEASSIPLLFYGTPETLETKLYFIDLIKKFPQIHFHFLFQDELPFFKRLEKIFLSHRDCYLHLTGTDIPQFPYKTLPFYGEIDENEVVIGPDRDGGFYYFGTWGKNGKVFSSPQFLEKSSEFVFETLLQLCRENGLKVRLLNEWFDVDTIFDLERALFQFDSEKLFFYSPKLSNP